MRPVTLETHISAPREQVFDYVADLANRVAFCDHYQRDFRLSRARSKGPGAAARFRIEPPFGGQWVEAAVVEHDPPRRIVEEGGMGRLGRGKLFTIFEFTPQPGGVTRVELITWTQPVSRIAGLREALGTRRWLKGQARITLERLRRVFEEQRDAPLARVTVAGYEPLKAARFGA